MVEDGTVFVLDWCLDLDLVSFYFNYETQKTLNLYTAMSTVYLFQSCLTFSDWFSPYLMNSWSRANLSRSNRQRGVVAEYSPWTRLMWREYSGAECRFPVLYVHRRWAHWQFDVGAEPDKWARGRALVLMLERQVDTIFNLGSIAITATIV